jgi:thiol-disulfide isomerase/thioredoxin
MNAHWRAPAGLHVASARLPVEGELPSFGGATGWLNSPPLTPAGLREKVVLVDFWTYTCINWLRQLPYLRAWAGKYTGHGLVVIGVHTPEFSFEHNADNVRQAAQDMMVTYPVATDNDYAIWRAFGNNYWPALYFVDAQGRIRHHHFGEGEYDQSEMVIQQLLAEAGSADAGTDLVSVDARGLEAPANWASLRSPGRSPATSTPAISTSSWDRQHQEALCDAASSSTDSHLVRPTEPTSTATATARSRSSGFTSSSASPAPSPTAPSRSPSSIQVPRPTASPSARPGGPAMSATPMTNPEQPGDALAGKLKAHRAPAQRILDSPT